MDDYYKGSDKEILAESEYKKEGEELKEFIKHIKKLCISIYLIYSQDYSEIRSKIIDEINKLNPIK